MAEWGGRDGGQVAWLTVGGHRALVDAVVDDVGPEDEAAVAALPVAAVRPDVRAVRPAAVPLVVEVERDRVAQSRHQGDVAVRDEVEAPDLVPVREDHERASVVWRQGWGGCSQGRQTAECRRSAKHGKRRNGAKHSETSARRETWRTSARNTANVGTKHGECRHGAKHGERRHET